MQHLRQSLPLLFALTLAVAGCDSAPIQPDTTVAPATAAPLPPAPATSRARAAAAAGETWNAAQIDWQPYEAGLAKAKELKKPVCLVLFTNWCPHCRNYSHVFEDARIVERARQFVMIHLNADEEQDVAGRYAPDGGYVPRTFFLGPDGAVDPDIHAPRPKFLYFYDEKNAAPLLAAMDTAVAKLVK